MNSNPPDHFQIPAPTIKLKSSDGEIFQVEVKVVKMSLLFKEMFEDLGVVENEIISIPENGPTINGEILGKVILWANHHNDDPAEAEDDEKDEKSTDDVSSWDAEFLQVDRTTLFQMIQAADYLIIKGLLDVTCKTVAQMMNEMTLKKIRRTLHIHNDFSPEEELRVVKEYAWCERYLDSNNEIPTDSVQNMDYKEDQVMKETLSNSVVVRRIFPHFPNNHLLKLSLANKMWNYEARSVLKKRGNLFARIDCDDNNYGEKGCGEKVESFLSATRQMNIVPFSGIKIDIHSEESWLSRGCSSKVLHNIILDQLPLRKVSIELREQNLNCPGFLMTKKILKDFSEVLEELSLSLYISGKERKRLIAEVFQQRRYSCLKVLKVDDFYRRSQHTSIVKALVSRAPTLQELHTDEPIASALNALEGSAAVLVCTQRIVLPLMRYWMLRSVLSSWRTLNCFSLALSLTLRDSVASLQLCSNHLPLHLDPCGSMQFSQCH